MRWNPCAESLQSVQLNNHMRRKRLPWNPALVCRHCDTIRPEKAAALCCGRLRERRRFWRRRRSQRGPGLTQSAAI